MQITIEGLGRLRSASIDLNPDLLVFVGPNNTSKTYVAYALYGLLSRPLPMSPLLDEYPDRLTALFGSQPLVPPAQLSLAHFIRHSAGTVLERALRSYEIALVQDTFAASEATFQSARLRCRLSERDLDLLADRLKGQVLARSIGPIDFIKDSGTLDLQVQTRGEAEPGQLETGLAEVATEIANAVFRPCRILPAERSAIQLFSREIALARIKAQERRSIVDAIAALPLATEGRRGGVRALPAALSRPRGVTELLDQIPRYPTPIADTLKVANDLAALSRYRRSLAPLADELERSILGGTVQIGDEGQIRFKPEGSSDPLDIHLASSSVKALSLLAFYLRHIIEPGDMLIVDEPELNLHPDNQRRVARVLGRLANAGVQVVITTHSDYVVRELNNLIMLSSDDDGAVRSELGYAAEETLRPEQVGVYLFGPTSVQQVPVDRSGFAAETIDREINLLNNTAERIYLSLFGKGGQGGR